MRYNTAMESVVEILIIEDDADINDVMATFLRRQGFVCVQAFSGSEACLVLDGYTNAQGQGFDLVITDLMLPGTSGHDLVERIRTLGDTPVIVVSAQAAPQNKIALLNCGADDYLVKPFHLDELLARVNVQLRHASKRTVAANSDELVRFKEWEINAQARTFKAAGHPIALTRLEFDILQTLIRYPKKAFTKRELLEAAWKDDCFVEEKAINVHMSNIRTKLKESGTDTYIQTVWGIGFKLTE